MFKKIYFSSFFNFLLLLISKILSPSNCLTNYILRVSCLLTAVPDKRYVDFVFFPFPTYVDFFLLPFPTFNVEFKAREKRKDIKTFRQKLRQIFQHVFDIFNIEKGKRG